MRKQLVLLFLQATIAVAIDWQALGINADPPSFTNALIGTAETELSMHTGPSEEFTIIDVIPVRSPVQVVGWMSRWLGEGYPYTPSLWVRAFYGDKKGWICAYKGAQRFLTRNGEPLFTMVVLGPNVAGYWCEDLTRIPLLSSVDFIAMGWVDGENDDHVFTIKYGDKACAFGIDYDSIGENFRRLPQMRGNQSFPLMVTESWWDLSILFRYPEVKYRFADNRSTDYMFSGPGYDFPLCEGIVSGFGSIFWVSDDWALLGDEDWGIGWIPLIDLRLYRAVGFAICPEPPSGKYKHQETDTGLSYWQELYPDKGVYEINIHRAYFVRIPWPKLSSVEFYQPSDALIPIGTVKPNEPIQTGFHETGEEIYRIKLPKQVDEKQEYRVKINTSYREDGDNAVEFVVSPLASIYGLASDWW